MKYRLRKSCFWRRRAAEHGRASPSVPASELGNAWVPAEITCVAARRVVAIVEGSRTDVISLDAIPVHAIYRVVGDVQYRSALRYGIRPRGTTASCTPPLMSGMRCGTADCSSTAAIGKR